ncbi:bifunctional 3-(3-hydroxy-phenyl)propionate/3-hydroxycinnamic acid hydroxylase [Hyalangium gracile]|uniref:bifunctional 3-(3-hydroxy-phenyl)propionate/3-hydroxycinnamic acid hydroxylase n=1 Tax=Hyalangium gracile TaxID=394092 RepID=UPI001CCCC226|nr:bifunctional 3-(3-hydroxy-phenyl)propionate/3-hydroxycinnamic acid hydroxylase [Hyalangium gracile]
MVPVAIVGAGPVGLTLANLLGLRGIQTVVLERNAGTVEEARAVSLDDEALRILAATGLLDTLSADMILGARATYYDSDGGILFEVEPTQPAFGYPLISLFLQPRLEAGLAEGTRRFEHVQVRFRHSVDRLTPEADGVVLEGYDADHRRFSLKASYVVGCDGGRSTVRSETGIQMVGSTYKERWLVLDAAGYTYGEPRVRFFCDPARPTVSVPIPHGCHRWEFLLQPHETDEEMLAPEKLDALLRRHIDPRSIQILRKVVYTFHARRAGRFRKGRILLAGDAAHLMPPFGGQGMCSGLRDAHNLSWKLDAVLQGRASDKLLDTYEAERSRHVREMTLGSTLLGQIVMARNRAGVSLRDAFFKMLSLSPETRLFVREARFKPPPQIQAGLLWRHLERGPWTGVMLPQPRVRTASGEVLLLDQVLGPDFTLLGLNADPSFALPAQLLARWTRLALRQLSVVRPSSRSQLRANEVVDVDGVFSSATGEKASGFCLLRPDRYVAAHFHADQAPLVSEFLERSFQSA